MNLADTELTTTAGRGLLLLGVAVVLQACDSGPIGQRTERTIPTDCSIASAEIISGALKDGIPALTDPEMAFPGSPGTEVWRDDDRVVGIVVDGQPIAIPLNIFWYHEIVNLNIGDHSIAATHCPLTGSSLVFDRSAFGNVEFGVSGLLYRNNLIMFDRNGGGRVTVAADGPGRSLRSPGRGRTPDARLHGVYVLPLAVPLPQWGRRHP